MKKLSILCIAVLTISICYSQTFKKQFNTDSIFIQADMTTINGSIYVIGTNTNQSGTFAYPAVIKFDASGDVEWAKDYTNFFGGNGKSIISTNSGDLIAIVIDNSSVDPQIGVMKIDASGNDIWTTSLSYPGLRVGLPVEAAEHNNGNLLIAATYNAFSGNDIFVFSLRANGTSPNFFNARVFDHPGNQRVDAIATRGIFFAMVGRNTDSTSNQPNMLLLISDTVDYINETTIIDGGSFDELTGVTFDTDTSVIVSGNSFNTNNPMDMYVGKFSYPSNLIWHKTYSSITSRDEPNDLLLDGSSIYISGQHKPIDSIFDWHSSFYELDLNGNLIASTYHPFPNFDGSGDAIAKLDATSFAICSDNNLLTKIASNGTSCGYADILLNTDPASLTITNPYINDYFESYTHFGGLNNSPSTSNASIIDTICEGSPVGIKDYKLEQNIMVYPNPTNSIVKIEIANTNIEIHSIEIYNNIGQRVKHFAQMPQTIDVNDLPIGNYLIQIKTSNTVTTKRFIKL